MLPWIDEKMKNSCLSQGENWIEYEEHFVDPLESLIQR